MKKELYESLSEKERLMYDELYAFSGRLTVRMEEIIGLLTKLLAEVNDDV